MRLRHKRIFFPAMLIGLGVWLLVGCVYIPTFGTTITGRNVSKKVGSRDSQRPIRVSHSTVEDVLRVLGEPPHATSDRRVLAYPWTVRHGIAVWPLCFAAYSVKGARTLVLRFDERHVLSSFELLRDDEPVINLSHSAVPKLPNEIWEERAAHARRIQAMREAATRSSTAPATQPR